MSLEQSETDNRILSRLQDWKISGRYKLLLGVFLIALYGFLVWILIDYLGKLVITMTIIPIIGFVFLFGFWGYLIANLGSFFVLLLTMYLNYGRQAAEMISLTDLIYILVLAIVAALISEQKDFIQKLYKQIISQQSEENRLIDSRDDYRNLVYRVPIGLYRTTPEGKILEASSALVEILGYPDFETLSFVNIGDELYVDPQDRENEQIILLKDGLVRDYE